MKYRSKPIEVNAIQWTGENCNDIYYFFKNFAPDIHHTQAGRFIVISGIHGSVDAEVGDWIICQDPKDIYPCRDSVFKKKYEPVDQQEIFLCPKCRQQDGHTTFCTDKQKPSVAHFNGS